MNSNDENTGNVNEGRSEGGDLGRGGHLRGGKFRALRLLKIPLFIVLLAAKGAVVMLLWNALIPDIFHGPELLYGQALGLMVLAKLLFGFGGMGFWMRGRGGFGPGGGRGWGHRHHRDGGGWRERRERWMKMSPEERDKLRRELKKRFEC